MTLKDEKKLKIGAAAGVAAPILAFACILGAIASDYSFSWTNNALSDLGVVGGLTGPVFNFGICVGGVLGVIFATLGLFPYVGKTVIGKIGALTFAAAALALIAIGVFNESFSGIHFAVSVAFFVLAPISLFIIACAHVLGHESTMAAFTIGIGVAAAIPWILQFTLHYVPNVAVPETVSALAVSAWTVSLSYKILSQTKR